MAPESGFFTHIPASVLHGSMTASEAARQRGGNVNRKRGGYRMTLQELYAEIGGDYDQAIRVLRVEKLLDKHICRMASNGVVQQLVDAGKNMDPTELFERAHAAKGVCANLGLTLIAENASAIAEEYRPGRSRTMTDEEVRQRLDRIDALFQVTVEGIRKYEAEK